MSSHTGNSTSLILLISLILSVIVISLFLKILKGILLLVLFLLVAPVMYWLVRSFWNNRKRNNQNKLKERA